MQDDTKQPGLSWSAQKPSAPAEPSTAPAVKTDSKPILPSMTAATARQAAAAMMQTQAPVYAGLLVGGIVVGVLLSAAWSSLNQPKANGLEQAANVSAAASTSAPKSEESGQKTQLPVVVPNQKAGSQVFIGKLSITVPTWIVVYVSREGKPGNALGARLFFAGDKQGSIGLLRNTEAGQTYFVGLSVDNGDKVFSLSKDKPMANQGGSPLWATFRAL